MTAFTHVLERVETEARALQPARVALTLVSAPFFAVGWVVGHVFRMVWFVVAWAWTALLVGWRTARGE